jgi:hypothetical protein
MSAPRKLHPDAEAALMAWYAQYQAAMNARDRAAEELRKLGGPAQKAKQMGLSARGLHLVVKRKKYELSRKLKLVGIRVHVESEQSNFAGVMRPHVQTPPTLHSGNHESAHTTATEVRRGLRTRKLSD